MKKLLTMAAVAAMTWSVCAEEEEEDPMESLSEFTAATANEPAAPVNTKVSFWPAYFAVADMPETPDVIGLRLTIPSSSKQENVTGFDVGFWGRSRYFEGFQFSILRNDVKDELSGGQVGLYNTIGKAEYFAAQVGAWNEAGSLRGGQLGLVNVVGHMEGVQIGLINRAETLYGFQIGIVNVIRDAEIVFCPVLNIGF